MPKLTGSSIYDVPLMHDLTNLNAHLTRAPGKVAEYILRHPLKTALMSINELAVATKTSTAAVNRLGNQLGLGGFTGLRGALVSHVTEFLLASEQVGHELHQCPDGGFSLEQQLRVTVGNLELVNELNPPDTFSLMVDCLAGARHIYISGFGAGYNLAHILADGLLPHCHNASAVNTNGCAESTAFRMAGLASQDVFLAISLPPYDAESVRLAKFALERGACVLALTDSPAAALSHIAQQTLFAPTHHPVLGNSLGPTMTVIEALLAAMALRNREASNQTRELADRALASMNGTQATEQSPR
ncbi:MurR/RpiR family transcriptional regulator [Pseudomonas sp. nanlin1]|uniref:MurR/RpiR family transcriptional regulator n=1 Tax=Pseudomonas sp. nanlin1 TaxID=3040605 RepID=UPI00388D4E21